MIPLSDSARSRSFPFVVISLIVLNIYIFFRELMSPDLEQFVQQWGLVPSLVDFSSSGWIIPFVTSQFLHGGWLHIGSNMLFLWVFGDNIEDSLGHLRFLVFYLLCGVVAGLTQYFFDPESSVAMIGASGAVAGVLGAYWRLYPNSSVHTLIPLGFFLTTAELPASLMIGLWFLTQIFSGVSSIGVGSDIGGVAFWAHVGGFLAGMAFVTVFPPIKRASFADYS